MKLPDETKRTKKIIVRRIYELPAAGAGNSEGAQLQLHRRYVEEAGEGYKYSPARHINNPWRQSGMRVFSE